MQLVNVVEIAQLAIKNTVELLLEEAIKFGTPKWFIYAGICGVLVVFGGLMSGLTLALVPLSLVDLEILKRSGTPLEQKQSAAILPVVQKRHQLLVTLLLCNAAAMEALPLYLDKLFNQIIAVILSVTLVLAFGEIIPQAICTRYGLSVGASFVWLVRILMIVSYPISYPIGKALDYLLGHDEALFRRAQLKALVSIHGQEAGKGGYLSLDETTIINGALDLTEKTAKEAMTPIESTFALDIDSKLDWEMMGRILALGHSRVPVYSGSPKNIIGLLLIKTLLTIRAENETPVSAISIRKIPRVPADMPLYDILNEFQKGHSHMAAVVKAKPKNVDLLLVVDAGKSTLSKVIDVKYDSPSLSKQNEEILVGDVIGIITLEDVFEELLQEEIVDETDEFIDVHKRTRVAAFTAASLVARAPSLRRLMSQKTMSKRGQGARKANDDVPASTK